MKLGGSNDEPIALALPAGFVVVDLPIAAGEDAHEVGRRAAEAAIAVVAPGGRLAYDGTRPIVARSTSAPLDDVTPDIVASAPLVDVSPDIVAPSTSAALDDVTRDIATRSRGAPLDSTHNVVSRSSACVSITHTRERAIAIAARVTQLGVDLVDDDDADRIAQIAERYFTTGEVALCTERGNYTAVFAAKEAALKALGLGLLDGGAFDRAWPVRVVSLDPPALVTSGEELALVIGRAGPATIAVVYR